MLQKLESFYYKQRDKLQNSIFYRFKLPRIKRNIKKTVFWLLNNRAIWVVVVGVLSGFVVYWLVGQQIVYVYSHLDDKAIRDDILKNAGIWNFITVVVAIPTAFLVWLYRDQNNRHAIENARKDVNLKDFQRLSELAAGLHLVEDKVTTEKEDGKTTIKIESSKVPNGDNSTISRREGSVSLQIAAVYQMRAFLAGEYGKHFQRPAFQLLISIWRSIVWPYLNTMDEEEMLDKFQREARFEVLKSVTSSPLAVAVQDTLTIDSGYIFREHMADLMSIVLAGMHLSKVDFENLNMGGAALQMANLSMANLSVMNFSGADLSGANLVKAHLHKTDLAGTAFVGANFTSAILINTDLSGANLSDADFWFAHLSNVSLRYARLSGNEFFGAYFFNVDFAGATIDNIKISRITKFVDCTCNEHTGIFVFENGKNINKEKTLELRNKLKSAGLILPEEMYDIGNIPDKIDDEVLF